MVSTAGKTQVFAQEGDSFLVLLEIDHADLADPLRFVNNTEDVTSNGESYTAFPFDISLPTDSDESPPRARLVIDNVSREIGEVIRDLDTAPTITIYVIRMDDFDAVEITLPSFTLRNVQYDVMQVSGELELEDLTREPFPARTFSPAEFPGLLR